MPIPRAIRRAAAGPWLRLALLAALLGSAGGCFRGCTSSRPPIHPNPNMDRQAKFLPQQGSDFFYDGAVMRPRVPGTVARGRLRENEAYFTGRSPWGFYLYEVPGEAGEALLARGEERYGIYCTPCHGPRGDGDGMLTQRTGVKTADLLEERIRQLAAGKLYEVITNGKGLMPSYRYPIPPQDRWAIVAWVKQLQSAATEEGP